MTDLPLIALGGVLGSSHCVGMCGGFALTVGLGSRGVAHNLSRQLVYSAGRTFTYGFLGAAAGFAGFWFARRSTPLVRAQALLSLAAGVLLVAQALIALGVVPGRVGRFWRGGGQAACLAGSLVGPLFGSPRRLHVLLAGVLNGFLPCGLVYGYLALASSTACLSHGLATMAAFGAGTVPVMVLTGVGVSAFSRDARRHLFRFAGVCVLVTGLLAVARGVRAWDPGETGGCPGCAPAAASPRPAPASR